MKRTIKAGLVGAIFAFCALIAIAPLFPQKAAAVRSAEQYKIVDQKNDNAATEAELNRLAADGWKVRTASSGIIILAR